MTNLPDNWEQCESEHNKHYDPYDDELEQNDGEFIAVDFNTVINGIICGLKYIEENAVIIHCNTCDAQTRDLCICEGEKNEQLIFQKISRKRETKEQVQCL